MRALVRLCSNMSGEELLLASIRGELSRSTIEAELERRALMGTLPCPERLPASWLGTGPLAEEDIECSDYACPDECDDLAVQGAAGRVERWTRLMHLPFARCPRGTDRRKAAQAPAWSRGRPGTLVRSDSRPKVLRGRSGPGS